MPEQARDRAWFLRGAASLALAGSPLTRTAAAFASTPALTPDEALVRLLAGNGRFVASRLTGGNGITARRASVAPRQAPFAIVLTCSDSRLGPEYIFDQRLGDIFVCRVAGNILDPAILGSIEYAYEHFHCPAVVVLGHQRCGAVTDTVELVQKNARAPEDIQRIVEAITPAVTATKRGSLSQADYVDAVVKTNAKMIATGLARHSAALEAAVLTGKLRVAPAYYSLDSGKVKILA